MVEKHIRRLDDVLEELANQPQSFQQIIERKNEQYHRMMN